MYWQKGRKEYRPRIRRYYRFPVRGKRRPLLIGWYPRYFALAAGLGVNICFGSASFDKKPVATVIDRLPNWGNCYRPVPTSGARKAVACLGQIPLCCIAKIGRASCREM